MLWVWPSEVPVRNSKVGKREQEERVGQKSFFYSRHLHAFRVKYF